MNKSQKEYMTKYKTVKYKWPRYFLQRSRSKEGSNNFVVAWLSNIITHVSQLNANTG